MVVCTVVIGPNLETFIRKHGEAYIVEEDEQKEGRGEKGVTCGHCFQKSNRYNAIIAQL